VLDNTADGNNDEKVQLSGEDDSKALLDDSKAKADNNVSVKAAGGSIA
jgi:hypothetical protein